MFGQSRNKKGDADTEGEARQPLLNRSRDDLADDNVVFAIDDDDSDDGHLESQPSPPNKGKAEHVVRFQEDVQVIGPPLRSTMASRRGRCVRVRHYRSRRIKRNHSHRI